MSPVPWAAADPRRALDRFRQQPFDALIVDAGTTDEDGLFVFDNIMNEAKRKEITCAGVLVLSEEQAPWRERVTARNNAAVLVRPVTLKQLVRKIQEMLASAS